MGYRVTEVLYGDKEVREFKEWKEVEEYLKKFFEENVKEWVRDFEEDYECDEIEEEDHGVECRIRMDKGYRRIWNRFDVVRRGEINFDYYREFMENQGFDPEKVVVFVIPVTGEVVVRTFPGITTDGEEEFSWDWYLVVEEVE